MRGHLANDQQSRRSACTTRCKHRNYRCRRDGTPLRCTPRTWEGRPPTVGLLARGSNAEAPSFPADFTASGSIGARSPPTVAGAAADLRPTGHEPRSLLVVFCNRQYDTVDRAMLSAPPEDSQLPRGESWLETLSQKGQKRNSIRHNHNVCIRGQNRHSHWPCKRSAGAISRTPSPVRSPVLAMHRGGCA